MYSPSPKRIEKKIKLEEGGEEEEDGEGVGEVGQEDEKDDENENENEDEDEDEDEDEEEDEEPGNPIRRQILVQLSDKFSSISSPNSPPIHRQTLKDGRASCRCCQMLCRSWDTCALGSSADPVRTGRRTGGRMS
jgi:hypothetical protein